MTGGALGLNDFLTSHRVEWDNRPCARGTWRSNATKSACLGRSDIRDDYRKIAEELIGEGRALLARDKTNAAEAEEWQKPALNVLRYIKAESYEAREERHGGFLEWAGTTLSERARKHNVRLTLDALEAAMSAPPAPTPSEAHATPPRHTRPVGPPEHSFDENLWAGLADEVERMRVVEETAQALGVALPQTIEWSGSGSYQPATDTVSLPGNMHGESADGYRATVAHELQHKVQAERGPQLRAYASARGSLQMLARELVQPDESLPWQLRATTMLAGVSAYVTFVVLGKTIGYQQELEADSAAATVTSAGIVVDWLQQAAARDLENSRMNDHGKTWLERVTSQVSRALDDDHPSFEARIDAARQRQDRPDDAKQTPSR